MDSMGSGAFIDPITNASETLFGKHIFLLISSARTRERVRLKARTYRSKKDRNKSGHSGTRDQRIWKPRAGNEGRRFFILKQKKINVKTNKEQVEHGVGKGRGFMNVGRKMFNVMVTNFLLTIGWFSQDMLGEGREPCRLTLQIFSATPESGGRPSSSEN